MFHIILGLEWENTHTNLIQLRLVVQLWILITSNKADFINLIDLLNKRWTCWVEEGTSRYTK